MAKQYIYPAINPIWMNPVIDFNPIYNTLPFDFQQPQKPYTQKAKKGLPQKLQVLSDWLPTLKIYNADQGFLVDTLVPSTPVNSVAGETFTVYEFNIVWADYDDGCYYIEITYDVNSGVAQLGYSLKEASIPGFIDGRLQVVVDGNAVVNEISTGVGNATMEVGKPYTFIASSSQISSAPNPRIRMTITKTVDGVATVIYDHSAVQTNTVSLSYSGIVQPDASYSVSVVTENTSNVIPPISISDNAPVDPSIKAERSGVIQLAENFLQTLVLQYTNSTNDFSVIFSTGILFALVVEGNIEEYTPAFDDVIYNDQEYNTTKLDSVPRREFNFYAGKNRSSGGIPPWMADKINWAFACDKIMIDGVYYQNTNGSKWEVLRADPLAPNFIGLKIPIIEVINRYLQSYNTVDAPEGSVQVISRDKRFLNNTSDITIANTFTEYSVLTKIIIYNNGGDIFTINASTSADGSSPITEPFTTDGRLKEVWEINEPFENDATLYLLGFAGTNCNVWVQYDQLDADIIMPPTSTKKHVKGTVYEYEEVTPGDFSNDWDIGTGQGVEGGRYEGCVISGTNGTKDRNGLVSVGWDHSQPLTRDTIIGAVNNLVTLSEGNLPSFHINIGMDKKGGSSPIPVLSSQNPGPNGNGSINIPYVGANTPFSIQNRARVTLKYVCITD